ncbi:MAG: hypothetical protein NZM42_12655 [Gemmatales bacterium]|nr:hypothetical protein [Gemmatales bacterium]MDW8224189.1 hypothetical protein [Gemmatales bacterium]
MEGLWIVSHVALWAIVALELLFLVALARQIGLLHERVKPVGARMLNSGPQIGDLVFPLEITDISGQPITLSVPRHKRTLLVFISPSCQQCEDLLPSIRSMQLAERNHLEIILIGAKSEFTLYRALVQKYHLDTVRLVMSDDLGALFQVDVVPYGVLVDREGKVRAKGIVNSLTHLESLLTAEELGHPSIESFMREQAAYGFHADEYRKAAFRD